MSLLGVTVSVAAGVASYLVGRRLAVRPPADLASHEEADRAVSAFVSHVLGFALVIGLAAAWAQGLIDSDALLANLPEARARNAVYFAWTTATIYLMHLGRTMAHWLGRTPPPTA